MKSLTARLARLAGPADRDPDLAERLYRGVCRVCVVAVFLLVMPINAVQDLPVVVNAAAGGLGVLAAALLVAARSGRHYPKVLALGMMAALTVTWFPNAGSTGSIPYYFLVALAVIVAVFDGRDRVVFSAALVVNAVVLLMVEFQRPHWVRPYASETDRTTDITGGFVVAAACLAAVVWTAIDAYRRERVRLVEAQAATAESKARLATLVDSTDDLIWQVDAEHFALTVFNASFTTAIASAYGVTARAGLATTDLFPSDTATEAVALYRRALRDGAFTMEYATPGGEASMLLWFSPVYHESAAIGVSVFCKDVTQQKRAEEARLRAEQQVLESRKLESLGRLAGGVAHDFNNMLGGIMGYADLLLDGEPDPLRREHLESILTAARRSADLTRKLLAFARRGKDIVEAVNLNSIVHDSLTMLKPSMKGDVRVVDSLEATWLVDGDPSQLNQVVLNLCMNASEAMGDGGTLTIESSNVLLAGPQVGVHDLGPGEYVMLRVRDTGVGMSEEVRARAFEPFFSTKGHAGGGTGLGLATVYGVVGVHHGAIHIDSAPGRGAVVTVWLPRGRADVQPKSAPEATSTGRGRILLVEDEALLRTFTSTALERLGYEVVTAEDGADAVRVFQAHRGSLKGILLDLKMPTMGGREAFVAMRGIDPSVPVLICSGYGDNEEAQGIISLGAKGLLAKPFRLAVLAQAVSKFD